MMKTQKDDHLLQSKLYFVVVNERRFKFIQANSQ